MRLTIAIGAGCIALAACGGPQTSQANNAQANISYDSRTATHAVPSKVIPATQASAPENAAVGNQTDK